MSVVLFTGPTLAATDAAAAWPHAVVLPPARQGDVWRAVQAHAPRAIGLIDGVFLHEPAVWHRELLWAMDRGVHVFGAASMGALRAAELAAFGMVGVGRVFAAYRDGAWPGSDDPFEDDDEVAVLHAPAELGALPMSDALVDLRDTLLAAEAAGVIGATARVALTAAMKALPFGQRSLPALAAAASARADAPHLAAWLPRGRVARKRLDALALVEQLGQFMATDPPPFAPAFRWQNAQVWADFVAGAEGMLSEDERLVLDELRLRPDLLAPCERAGLGRLRATQAAPAPSEAEIRAQLGRFREQRGLARRSELDDWRAANAAAPAAWQRLVRDEAALAQDVSARPAGLEQAMLDELRLSGGFAPLLARARAKAARLAGQSPAPGDLDAAVAWHAAHSGTASGWVDAPVAHAPWADISSFRYALWREYRFRASDPPDPVMP